MTSSFVPISFDETMVGLCGYRYVSCVAMAAAAFQPLAVVRKRRPRSLMERVAFARGSQESPDNGETIPLRSIQPESLSLRPNEDHDANNPEQNETEYLRAELSRIESLEQVLAELEEYGLVGDDGDDDDDMDMDEYDDDAFDFAEMEGTDDITIWDKESLEELLGSLPDDDETTDEASTDAKSKISTEGSFAFRPSAALGLEQALLQGVVPVSAGVGSECLPGDFGFDPLCLADRDLMRPVQSFLLGLLPPPILPSLGPWNTADNATIAALTVTSSTSSPMTDSSEAVIASTRRPKALILRDYREAEIRNGRLAMLAAIFWPLQEMLDRFLLAPDQFGPLLYGPVTLPYFPLIMTAILMLLGYLDIYSQAIKDMDQIGEAFLPGDCFWDPLRILQGAPDRMTRNMQERELFNGRAAMLAVAAYALEEAFTHKALIEIENNALLLEPPFQVPVIQNWLDNVFTAGTSSLLQGPSSGLDYDAVDPSGLVLQALFSSFDMSMMTHT
jgi:Chlorophyll A-B binding protein